MISEHVAAERWTALLKSLDEKTTSGGVWKNCDESLAGDGDLDYVAERSEWPAVRAAFDSWCNHFQIPEAFACEHKPGALYLVALTPGDDNDFWQLDIRDRSTLRGATLFTASSLQPFMIEDPRGFRTLRPGGEASFKLVLKCVDDHGRIDHDLVIKEGVVDLIRSDRDGYQAIMSLFGTAAPTMEEVGLGLADGATDGDLGPVFEHFRRQSFRQLGVSAQAAYSRISLRRCPFLGRTTGKRPSDAREMVDAHQPVLARS